MKKRLLYIIGIAAMALTSCSDDMVEQADFLNGKEKTPLGVSALLDKSSSATTRAVDKDFENGDQLIAYLRHVTWNGSTGDRTSVTADQAPRLVTFTTTGSEAWNGTDITPIGTGVALGMTADNTKQATGLTAQYTNTTSGTTSTLYWDDFSNSVDDDHDLRTSGHYLESYYGYCYNGGTPTTALVPADGTLGWTVATDQHEGIKKSDLLWSAEQTPIPYAHVDGEGNRNHGTLILPYTHAMSKVTIEIVLNEGFDTNSDGSAKAFGASTSDRIATTPTLFANRVTTTTAPTYTHSTTVASGDDAEIQMSLADDEKTTKKSRVYEAVIAPTVMKDGNKLAEVTVDGNKYDINLTNAVLTTIPAGATAAWDGKLKAYTVASTTLTKNSPEAAYSAENGGITLPGVNYRIKVTLNKQRIDVKAYITDWEDVGASIEGDIMFDADVVTSFDATGTEITSTSFDLWRSLTNTDAASYDADGDTDGIQKASTYTYNSTETKWEGAPLLYWVNGSTPYYFRALAKVENPATAPNVITSVSGDQSAAQGLDLLWAQTSEHKGKDAEGNVIQENGADKVYAAGGPIDPRTGSVPLTFEHAMSKVSVKLMTSDGDDKVNLAGATISIINLYDGGTINISTGKIESLTSPLDLATPGDPRTLLNATVDAQYRLLNQIVIPQSLVNDKDGNARGTTPTFYQSAELTKIYNDGTSLPAGGGEGTYYLTSTLDRVNYTDETATSANALLPGAVSTSTIKTPAVLYTYTEYVSIPGNESVTEDEFNDLEDAQKTKTDAVNYTAEEAKEYNAALPGAVAEGDFHYYQTNGSSEQHTPGELKSAGNKIMMYITLTDGTRYSIELSKCKDSSDNLVTEWVRGEHYTYEITLGKEEIIFRAIVKDWVEKTGSGNATLDWD